MVTKEQVDLGSTQSITGAKNFSNITINNNNIVTEDVGKATVAIGGATATSTAINGASLTLSTTLYSTGTLSKSPDFTVVSDTLTASYSGTYLIEVSTLLQPLTAVTGNAYIYVNLKSNGGSNIRVAGIGGVGAFYRTESSGGTVITLQAGDKLTFSVESNLTVSTTVGINYVKLTKLA